MIFDTIKNKHIYLPISRDISNALNYLARIDFIPIAVGKYKIDGENFYVLVQEYSSVIKAQSRWECHRKYVDIQFMVYGIEQIGITNISDLKEITEYNADKDIIFLEGDGDYITIKKNSYAIFFPEDAHRPKIAPENRIGRVKKVVVKIPIDQ